MRGKHNLGITLRARKSLISTLNMPNFEIVYFKNNLRFRGRNCSKSICSIFCFNTKEGHIINLSKQSILRTYKLTHGTRSPPPCGIRWEGWMGPISWVFALLGHNKINVHGLDSPKLALQDDTIFVNYVVI